jgi:hypothetical protein
MSTLEEKIAVMQAALDGAEIEWTTKECENWEGKQTDSNAWNWGVFNYRVKPQPKEIWVNEYDDVKSQIHGSQFDASRCLCEGGITRHYREVME